LKKYKSVDRVKKIEFDKLKIEIGASKAEILIKHFKISSK